MPAFESADQPASSTSTSNIAASSHSFPVTRDHILHCSYDYWFPKYRTSCIKSKIIKLPPVFIDYIREDGIILSNGDNNDNDDEEEDDDWEPTTTAYSRAGPEELESDSDSDSDDAESKPPRLPPNQRFPELHQSIKDMIKELGGAVAPKLNWSSPKDAAWISPHQNTIKCTTPDDIYLLLKSSSFITHDLDHAFDGTVPTATSSSSSAPSTAGLGFQPVLVLRAFFNPQTAQEFRCFVKQRSLIAITQRDLNHYDFLQKYRAVIIDRVQDLFDTKLRFTFPDGNFCFDVYIPEVTRDLFESDSSDSDGEEDPDKTLGRARLIDINPWAPRTDTLLFDWSELLDLHVPRPLIGTSGSNIEEGVVRLQLAGNGQAGGLNEDDTTTEEEEDEEDDEPELRLVEKDDPAAYNFSSPQYSAHKLPKEVVDASASGSGGLREFAQQWNDMVSRRR
ncbi:D123-domain-containing protein [Coniella lustricola]|uniref:D123-domain-containing protein n=1 Tax=Coniella lustricola TaxID=2025994 RepID=A0A2T2ZVR4_9PEZI|nr:D123-domain-containing protein [Coniella lustricola]